MIKKCVPKDNLKTIIVDCCIQISFYIDIECRVVFNVASSVNLYPLCLVNKNMSMTCLVYGIYNIGFHETNLLNVVFVDVGHANMQVCAVAFKKGEVKILAHAFNHSLGGRDFDDIIFKNFASFFFKIDIKLMFLVMYVPCS